MISLRASLRFTAWRGPDFINRVPRILTAYGKALDDQLQTEIETQQFAWPRETKRRNRSTVGSPRDIVDLGAFLRSQKLEPVAPTRLRFTWDPVGKGGSRYASLIFTGYVTSRGSIVPGRDWMTPALTKQPPARFFADHWRALDR